MAKNPHLTQDKLDLLAQIPEEVIELISLLLSLPNKTAPLVLFYVNLWLY